MKIFLANSILILLVELFLLGCGLKTSATNLTASNYNTAQLAENENYNNSQDVTNIQVLVNENINALQNEDIEKYMNQIHPKSPHLESTRELMLFLFEFYDMNYEINNLDIVEIFENQAKVRVTQTTRKIAGAEFRDNRTVVVHTLKRYQGQWKFFITEIRSIEYLD